jgi:hypothetical protein
MLTVEQFLDAAAASCKARREAIKIYRRYGLAEAIDFLRRIKGTNLDVLEILKRTYQ